jgi:hypothetical protein
MESDEQRRVREILSSMVESARPTRDDMDMVLDDTKQLCLLELDDKNIDDLDNLIRVTVQFYDYLRSIPPWPHFPDDPGHNTH